MDVSKEISGELWEQKFCAVLAQFVEAIESIPGFHTRGSDNIILEWGDERTVDDNGEYIGHLPGGTTIKLWWDDDGSIGLNFVMLAPSLLAPNSLQEEGLYWTWEICLVEPQVPGGEFGEACYLQWFEPSTFRQHLLENQELIDALVHCNGLLFGGLLSEGPTAVLETGPAHNPEMFQEILQEVKTRRRLAALHQFCQQLLEKVAVPSGIGHQVAEQEAPSPI